MKDGSSVVDQMTRLKLKLQEKRLKRHNMDNRPESAMSARSYDGEIEALHRALRRKQDLLQRLREEHMLENLNRPRTWGGSQKLHQPHFVTTPQIPTMAPNHLHNPAPILPYLPSAPPALPQLPRIIQQTLPQQPATIIQQLPQQQPLITQIPPPQAYPAARSGSIKEDMVELMLMQNAQMHQIIMHNMMLRAMPAMTLSTPNVAAHFGQDQANPCFMGSDFKPRESAVHHHHHYGSTAAGPQLPPLSYHTWLPRESPISAGQAGGQLSPLHHVTAAPTRLPPLNL
ncbi:uncharacterized protein C21orf58 isoform X2 [Betta splendens]|uniref:Uncharacterized protein C21orf58 isoform X2 n=1 Tax=Betta splendens TaxID=158456 RepID=A0A6P7LPN1_BETSP|nr:uncharacterized protein C21orf58 isoform X2 [Betta splendens]